MIKRIVIKTLAICTGVFIIFTALAASFLLNKYELDTEKKYKVLVASTDLKEGTVINESMIYYRTIKQSALNRYMITSINAAAGKKLMNTVKEGDYISSYNLLPGDKWHEDGDKVIVLPMDIETRLANLIKKGSVIDIKVVLKDDKALPQTVLSKIRIEDMLDENGISMGDSIGNRKAFAVLILDEIQRDRVYAAAQLGKFIFELYCDRTQEPAVEQFRIPEEYLEQQP